MRRPLVLAAVLCVTACAHASPADGPAAPGTPGPPYAVMLRLAGPGHPYVVQLVAQNGVAGAFATAMSRSPKTYYFPPGSCSSAIPCGPTEIAAFNLPEVSISTTRVYFLDGETLIKSMTAEGTVQALMNVDAPANSQVVFSVSPDDTQIAVAVITLATDNEPASFQETLSVESLGKASSAVLVYSSTTQPEWPVAWNHGELVLAVGPPNIAVYNTAYGAVRYQVVDPATGSALAMLDCAAGLLTPAGTACVSGFCPRGAGCGPGMIGRQSYDGVKTTFELPAGSQPQIISALAQTDELSPDGTAVAVTALPTEPGQTRNDTLLVRDGGWSFLTRAGAPIGWIDDTHLMVAAAYDAFVVDPSNPSVALPLRGDAMRQQGFPTLAGVLPTNLV